MKNFLLKSNKLEKILIFLWALMLMILVGTPILSTVLDKEELFGNSVFIILPSSIILIITIIISYYTEKKYLRLSKFFWFSISFYVLMLSLIPIDFNRNFDEAVKASEMILIYPMLILTFPIGFLVPLLEPYLLHFINEFLLATFSYKEFEFASILWKINLCLSYLFYIIFGYFQWFLLIPYFYKK